MKHSVFYSGLAVLVIFFVSCKGLKSDAKKYVELYSEYTKLATEASRDQIITAAEADGLNKIKLKTDELQKEIDKKTRSDEAMMNEWKERLRELDWELVTEKYIDACLRLYDCEGGGEVK